MEHLYFCLAQERAVSLLELRHHCYPKSATHFQIVWKLYTVEILIIMDFNICINMIVRREIIICLSLSIKKKKKDFYFQKNEQNVPAFQHLSYFNSTHKCKTSRAAFSFANKLLVLFSRNAFTILHTMN